MQSCVTLSTATAINIPIYSSLQFSALTMLAFHLVSPLLLSFSTPPFSFVHSPLPCSLKVLPGNWKQCLIVNRVFRWGQRMLQGFCWPFDHLRSTADFVVGEQDTQLGHWPVEPCFAIGGSLIIAAAFCPFNGTRFDGNAPVLHRVL